MTSPAALLGGVAVWSRVVMRVRVALGSIAAVACIGLTSPTVGASNRPPAPVSPSALPKPNQGTKPEASGDRGGWAQLATLGVMTGGLAVIGTVIVRSSRRRTASLMTEIDPAA